MLHFVHEITITDPGWSSVDNDKFWAFLSLKVGYSFTEDLRQALEVTPVECGPWRKDIVIDLLKLIRHRQLSQHEIEAVESCVTRYQHVSATMYELIMKKIQHPYMEENKVFAGCIAPPTMTCYHCDSILQKKQSSCICYTVH